MRGLLQHSPRGGLLLDQRSGRDYADILPLSAPSATELDYQPGMGLWLDPAAGLLGEILRGARTISSGARGNPVTLREATEAMLAVTGGSALATRPAGALASGLNRPKGPAGDVPLSVAKRRGLLGLEGWDPNRKTAHRKQVAEYTRQGLLDPGDRDAAVDFMDQVRDLRSGRHGHQSGLDAYRRLDSGPVESLDLANIPASPKTADEARNRQWIARRVEGKFGNIQDRLESRRRDKAARERSEERDAAERAREEGHSVWTEESLAAPIVANWNKSGIEKFKKWARGGPDFASYAEDEARRATLEAIAREARKRGLKIRHTSKGRDGRASSRYVVFPDGQEIRISDHHLPDTPARSYMAEQGIGPRWSGDLVVSDWKNRDMDSYFAEMAEIVAGDDLLSAGSILPGLLATQSDPPPGKNLTPVY